MTLRDIALAIEAAAPDAIPYVELVLLERIARALGPEDEFDPSVNGDPCSMTGEEDESGFDDMPVANGWEDEEDPEDDEGGDDEDC